MAGRECGGRDLCHNGTGCAYKLIFNIPPAEFTPFTVWVADQTVPELSTVCTQKVIS